MLADFWQTLTRAEPAPGTSGAVLLEDLAVLEFSGADAVSFLQGYLTCDTTALSPAKAQPAALCNLKGRVVTFGWALGRDDAVDYLLHRSLTTALAGFMQPYLAFSKTELKQNDSRVVVAAATGADPMLDLQAPGDTQALQEFHERYGTGDRQTFDQALINARVPWVTAATSAEFLPQALNLVSLGAVSFDKGCYLGQEVVARAQHRGRLKRHLHILELRSGALPEPGTTLVDDAGRSMGTVVQAAAPCDDLPARCLAVLQEDAPTELNLEDPEAVLTVHR